MGSTNARSKPLLKLSNITDFQVFSKSWSALQACAFLIRMFLPIELMQEPNRLLKISFDLQDWAIYRGYPYVPFNVKCVTLLMVCRGWTIFLTIPCKPHTSIPEKKKLTSRFKFNNKNYKNGQCKLYLLEKVLLENCYWTFRTSQMNVILESQLRTFIYTIPNKA